MRITTLFVALREEATPQFLLPRMFNPGVTSENMIYPSFKVEDVPGVN